MNLPEKIKIAMNHPGELVEWFLRNPTTGRVISDKKAISILYKLRFHRNLNWDKPETLNEKLLWLTVYDRQPVYNTLVDKYAAKQWISQKLLGGGYSDECIIPTYGVFSDYDNIDFDKLPSSFVIKATHDSGTVVVCSDKSKLDHEILKKQFEKALSKNYYWFSREWAYKDVTPRIIVEKKLDSIKGVPEDYKIFCFNGKAKFWFYASDRDTNVKSDYYNMDWEKYSLERGHPNSRYIIQKPECWDEMVSIAEFISQGFPHIRVDFYIDKYGHFYIGELTLTDGSGLLPFVPDKWDKYFGEMLELPNHAYAGNASTI